MDSYYDEDEDLSISDNNLFDAVRSDDAAAVRQALRDGANASAVRYDNTTPLTVACEHGYDEIIRILLDAGANARWTDNDVGDTAVGVACREEQVSSAEILLNHDSRLVLMANWDGWTPLFYAIHHRNVEMVDLLLDLGANVDAKTPCGVTALMHACQRGGSRIVSMLLSEDPDVKARDGNGTTALHYAASFGDIDVMSELIRCGANIFTCDREGTTPFDLACSEDNTEVADYLLQRCCSKLTQDHGRLVLHVLLKVVKYSFVMNRSFHPPLNPLQIGFSLGKLTLKHWRTLLQSLDTAFIRNRDDAGKLPIHIACQTNAPVEVLALILELGADVLHMTDLSTGALPIHYVCGATPAVDYASVRYLVEHGGVGTLAARNRQGALPLHVLCGSKDPPLLAVQYLIHSYPGSVGARTNEGKYPFMMAAYEKASASLSVLYTIVRANPTLIIPR